MEDTTSLPLCDWYTAHLSTFEFGFSIACSLGGIRSLSFANRTNFISITTSILSNSSFNPFLFIPTHSLRILSGEEEGLFAWLAVNYHSMLQHSSISDTFVELPTLGNIELNFISSSIAFQPHPADTLQHTFQLSFPFCPLTLYSMSYLSHGYNTFQDNYLGHLIEIGYQQYTPHSAVIPSLLDYCLYSGYRESYTSSSPSVNVEIYGPSVPAQDAMERCLSSIASFLTLSESTTSLFIPKDLESGLWPTVYQPSLSHYHDTQGNMSHHFVGTALISYAAALLHLPTRWTLSQWRDGAKRLCGMSFHDVMIYATTADLTNEDTEIYNSLLPSSCLLSCYIFVLLKGVLPPSLLCSF
jgi:hypothetical protein